jgi:hypothetical protein
MKLVELDDLICLVENSSHTFWQIALSSLMIVKTGLQTDTLSICCHQPIYIQKYLLFQLHFESGAFAENTW